MNNQYDEPDFLDIVSGKMESDQEKIKTEIRTLCFEQPFAVLATQDQDQPYANLISFAVSEDLRHLVFSTPTRTRKYKLISRNNKVSFLIDNRAQQPESINQIRAVTINGEARILEDPQEIKYWSGLLVKRHRYLEKFINAPFSSQILVDIEDIIYVRRFQEVYRWVPGYKY
ncbi:MAG: pyridoxamine 5'-phosphate oxidase family protein [Bacillota bacterium]